MKAMKVYVRKVWSELDFTRFQIRQIEPYPNGFGFRKTMRIRPDPDP